MPADIRNEPVDSVERATDSNFVTVLATDILFELQIYEMLMERMS
jgi:hypothetical protein